MADNEAEVEAAGWATGAVDNDAAGEDARTAENKVAGAAGPGSGRFLPLA